MYPIRWIRSPVSNALCSNFLCSSCEFFFYFQCIWVGSGTGEIGTKEGGTLRKRGGEIPFPRGTKWELLDNWIAFQSSDYYFLKWRNYHIYRKIWKTVSRDSQPLQQLNTGWMKFDSRREQGIFLFDTVSRQALGPTQPPVQCVPAVNINLNKKIQDVVSQMNGCGRVSPLHYASILSSLCKR
jgi:hypothetical protein